MTRVIAILGVPSLSRASSIKAWMGATHFKMKALKHLH